MSVEQLAIFLKGLAAVDIVALDTESSGHDLRDGTGRVIGFSLAFDPTSGAMPPWSAYLPISHIDYNYSEETISQVMEIVLQKKLVMHNAKHDLVALERMGYPFHGTFYDTMLMAHLLDENLPNKSLDYVARKYVGEHKERSKEMQTLINAFGWGMLPAEQVAEYAQHDALITYLVFRHLQPQFEREVAAEYWDHEQRFIRTLAEIESTGVRVDPDFINSEIARGRGVMDGISEDLGFSPTRLTELGTYLLSTLNLPVLKTTPAGRPSFDRKTMEKYDVLLEDLGNPTARMLLTYRGWQKVVSSTYEPLLQLVSPDGRVRPNFKIHGTVTGRLSCERPNLQQIPRSSSHDWNGNAKRAFIADPGWRLINFDYKNLEFRLAAAYAREWELIEIFNTGRDVFSEMAKSLGMERQDVKTLVYTIMFGGGAQRIATVFNVPFPRAVDILEDFYFKYPSLRKASNKASGMARRGKRIQIWSGRYRHFADAEQEAHKAFNSMIQGGAADIVKRQISRVHSALDPSEARIVLTVHDSLVVEIKDDKVDALTPDIKALMETVVPSFGVKFEVETEPWTK